MSISLVSTFFYVIQEGLSQTTSSDMKLEMKKLLTERNNENLRDSFTGKE